MNIIERGRAFLQSPQALAGRTAWDWKQCPACGSRLTIKNGGYTRKPRFFTGRQAMRVQRHLCHACAKSCAEQSALLVRGSWYAREVHRSAVDHWQHGRMSLRRTAEFLRSWLGRQERWRLWRPVDPPPPGAACYLAASTVHRWLDRPRNRRSCPATGTERRRRSLGHHLSTQLRTNTAKISPTQGGTESELA